MRRANWLSASASHVRLPGRRSRSAAATAPLKLRGTVFIDKLVHLGYRRPNALPGGEPGVLDHGRSQEDAAPVGLDRLAEGAPGPRVEAEAGEVGDEDVRFQATGAVAGAGRPRTRDTHLGSIGKQRSPAAAPRGLPGLQVPG